MKTQQEIEKYNFQSVNSEVLSLLNEKKEYKSTLKEVCNLLVNSFKQPNTISIRIIINEEQYTNEKFVQHQWIKRQNLTIPGDIDGKIEIFYADTYLRLHKNEFFDITDDFLKQLATILSGFISQIMLKKLVHDNKERTKELKGITKTTEILRKKSSLEDSLNAICAFLPEAWQYPQYTVARIIYDDKIFKSRKFKETPWVQKQKFETPDSKTGSIEIFYLKEFPEADEGPFLNEERNLIDTLAGIISSTVSKNSLQNLLHQNTERLKELRGINQTSLILKQSKSIEESLKIICTILPEAWQYPGHTAVRIIYGKKTFQSTNFKETKWLQKQSFETTENKKGIIEVYYLKKFPEADEGPFLKEERNLLINLASLIAGSASKQVFTRLINDNKERLKELKAINQTSAIIANGWPVNETLQEICAFLPKSWQYPKHTASRIIYEGKHYVSSNFNETPWKQSENFVTFDNKKGTVEIYYLKDFPASYEGPFLREERALLINICKLISGYINDYKGREYYRMRNEKEHTETKPERYRESLVKNKRPLQLFFNQKSIDKYIYLDMMKYKVKEILFVSNLYDAYIIANEDNIFEQFMGEIYQYSLFSLPRITGVSSEEEALELIDNAHFDMVILMAGIDREAPVKLSEKIKNIKYSLPIYLLVNHKNNIKYFEEIIPAVPSVDKLFVWNGDSQIFFAIVKSIEDRVNVENDTNIGLVRIILLIEDAAEYYSKYLQILYSIVFTQVQQILPEVEKNELDKICKMRSRPKILLARNFEDAVSIFNRYKEFLLCVISDMEFDYSGKKDKHAGEKFIKYVHSHSLNLPVIIQSADKKNQQLAKKLNSFFIHKNSDTLAMDLKKFLTYYMGFGDFIFRDKKGKEIARAKSLTEFEDLLNTIPNESFLLHASDNQYSIWLMARGEIQLARKINPIKIADFKNVNEAKRCMLEEIKNYQADKKKGKIICYDSNTPLDEKNIYTLAGGSLGGKGRGLAFICTLINNLDFSRFTDQLHIATPKTGIIGTDEFDQFIQSNHLQKIILDESIPYDELKNTFIQAKLSQSLKNKLEKFIEKLDKPIAIRSSSLSEDSLTQPFAGIFETYIIPNISSDKTFIQNNTEQAIKLVFASIYSNKARNYFKAVNHKIEDEKMAVILQELVGKKHDNYYYPSISGTAQSLNYYPVSHMQPEEGFAILSVGLGTYIANGNKAFRFSPKYPKTEIYTTKDLLKSAQTEFYAVNLAKEEFNLAKEGELAALELLDISFAEKHGNLTHCVSVYNPANDRIEPGLAAQGPRVVNFANILKYNYIPLPSLIEVIIKTFAEAIGSPVEIEFAIELEKERNKLSTFHLLQVRPLVYNQLNNTVDFDSLNHNQLVLLTHSSLGNGEINDINDIIFVDLERFDKLNTQKMVNEIEFLNNKMLKEGKPYILIGPGRWGTSDKYLGIPVNWPQISNAKVIVEISLANFPLDSSLGSHFFHNVSSMNIGYFSVLDSSNTDFIKWDIIYKQKAIGQTQYFRHVSFSKPLKIVMDGKNQSAAIIYNK